MQAATSRALNDSFDAAAFFLLPVSGYYQRKVNELREEREKRLSKGKTDSADQIEKVSNAEQQDWQTNYGECSGSLLAAAFLSLSVLSVC